MFFLPHSRLGLCKFFAFTAYPTNCAAFTAYFTQFCVEWQPGFVVACRQRQFIFSMLPKMHLQVPEQLRTCFFVQLNSRTYLLLPSIFHYDVLVPANVQGNTLGPDKFLSYPISVEDSLFIHYICRGRCFSKSSSRLG